MGITVGDVEVKASLDRATLKSSLNSAKGDVDSWASGIESRTSKLGSAIGGALKTAMVAGGVAAAGAATAGLMSFKDLESAASSAASKSVDVNGKSVEEIKAQYDSLQKHVIDVSRDLGQATVFDPKDVAATYDVLAGKGYNLAQVGKTELLPFLNLAAATQGNLADTTDLVTGTMNSFGMSMNDSQKVCDMYAKAVNATSAGQDTFNYAMRQGGAAAAASGMPLQEYLAIVGDLAGKNYTGEQSGAALKTAVMSLYNPTKAQNEVFAKLGITYDQVNPRTHKFIDTIALLKSKGADIGDFGKIFTESSGSIMYALSGDTEKVKELSASISDSGGLAQAQADLVMGSDKLVGAFEQAKGSTADLFIALGEYLEPAAVKVLNAWTSLVPKIEEFGAAIANGDWSKAGKMLAEGWDAAKAKFGELYSYLESKVNSIDWGAVGTKAGQLISSGIQSGIQVLSTIGQKIAGWIESQGGWSGLGTKIAGLITSAWKSFSEWATPIINGLKDAFTKWAGGSEPTEWGKKLGRNMVDGIKSLFGEGGKSLGIDIANMLLEVSDWVTAGISAGLRFARGFVSEIVIALAEGINSVSTTIKVPSLFGGEDEEINIGIGDKQLNDIKSYWTEWGNSAGESLFTRPYAGSSGSSTNSNPNYGSGSHLDETMVNGQIVKVLNEAFPLTKAGTLQITGSIENPEIVTNSGNISPESFMEQAAKQGMSLTEAYNLLERSIRSGQARISTWSLQSAGWSQKLGEAYKKGEAAADKTTKASEEAAKNTKESTDYLKGGLFDAGNAFKTLSTTLQNTGQSVANRLTQASQNALNIGNSVSAKFQGAGNAVCIGLDAQGRQIAVIGEVAQSKFAAAGGQFVSAVTSGSMTAKATTESAAARSASLIQGVTSGFSTAGNSVTGGLQAGANSLYGAANAVSGAASRLSNSVWTSGYTPATGYGSSNYVSPGTGMGNTGFFDDPWMNSSKGTNPAGFASGTETHKPQLAMIGEDGTEFVIPTRRKRWDLLLRAMRAYGIHAMAEGGSAGASVGSNPTEADEMTATFGIRGLASMSKQVQKILSDLKDFFRITWSIIKSEGQVYWRQINTSLDIEITTLRDNAWAALIGIKNTGIQSFRELVDSGKAIMAEMWPDMEPSMASVHDGIIYSFDDARSQTSNLLEQMNSDALTSLQTFQASWTGVWQQLSSDLSSTASNISSFLQGIAAQVSNISVNVSMGGGYGGGGGGDYYSSPDMSGMGGGQQGGFTVNPDGSANFVDTDCFGNPVLVNALKYTNPSGQVSYINPLNYIEGGGISGYQGAGNYNPGGYNTGGGYMGGGGAFGAGGVYAPGWETRDPWAAYGAVVEKPSKVHVAERGPELILPANLTRMFLDMAGSGAGGSIKDRIVNEIHLFLDGKDITDSVMNRAVSRIQLRGGKPTF